MSVNLVLRMVDVKMRTIILIIFNKKHQFLYFVFHRIQESF